MTTSTSTPRPGPALPGAPATIPASSDSADRRTWLMLAVLITGQFMALLDVTIVNVAIPTIHANLHASGAAMQLVVAGYTVTYAMLLITGARLGDLRGHRNVFLAGLSLFTLASLACGLAPGTGTLVGARLVQGAGAALMVPQILSVIQRRFSGAARTRALGVYAATLASGAVVGQVLGGVLVSTNLLGASWRPVFLVIVPVGVAAALLVPRLVPVDHVPGSRRLDLRAGDRAAAGPRPRARLARVDLGEHGRRGGAVRRVRAGRAVDRRARWRPAAQPAGAGRAGPGGRAGGGHRRDGRLRRVPVQLRPAPAARARRQRAARRPHLRAGSGGVRRHGLLVAAAAQPGPPRPHPDGAGHRGARLPGPRPGPAGGRPRRRLAVPAAGGLRHGLRRRLQPADHPGAGARAARRGRRRQRAAQYHHPALPGDRGGRVRQPVPQPGRAPQRARLGDRVLHRRRLAGRPHCPGGPRRAAARPHRPQRHAGRGQSALRAPTP